MKQFLILIILIGGNSSFSWAQTSVIKEKSMVTNKNVTITIQGDYREAKRTPTRPVFATIYRRDSKKLLLGNPCAEAVRGNYGMKYEVIPQNFKMSGTKFFFNNLWSNTKLWFNNGPFWKSRMHKKIEKCRMKTGDYVF